MYASEIVSSISACRCYRQRTEMFRFRDELIIEHSWPATLGPHHWHTRQFPLVESPRPERIQYKLATVVYGSLNFIAPSYLAADLPRLSRRRLRSSLTHQLDVRQSQCATVGDRMFATAGARLWNSLPADIVSCDTLPHFRREVKTFLSLFRQSYPSILL